MAATPLPPGLQELVNRGVILADSAVVLGKGNQDRAHQTDAKWKVSLPDGRPAKLTIGPDLSDLARRHAAFARACPSVVPPLYFVETVAGQQILAEEYVTGRPLAEALVSGELSDETLKASFARLCDQLDHSARTSSAEARDREWAEWAKVLVALAGWTNLERQTLAREVLPALYRHLSTEAPVTRWSNRDFVAANLLVDGERNLRLIDLEFAAATHFWREDAVRFHTLSPVARAKPHLFAAALPPPGPAWHLYFWLRQWQLECTHNQPEYLARVRESRLGAIRRFAEVVLHLNLTDWSVAPTSIESCVEQSHWSSAGESQVEFHGWCHAAGPVSLRSAVLYDDRRRLAESPLQPRSDVQAHFGNQTASLETGFTLTGTCLTPESNLTLGAYTTDGLLLPFHSVEAVALGGRESGVRDYAQWARRHDPDPPAGTPTAGPLFSVLLPVFRPPVEFLQACIQFVRDQHYAQWELCIVDDASASPAIAQLLEQVIQQDPRIRVQVRASNGGIALATNDALAAARGEFIVLLDHDDLLRPHALAEFARQLAVTPEADLIYSDEDKITAEGDRVLPMLKPAYSPEFLLGVMYFGHALCVRTRVARAVGGFDPAFNGVQDYEFALRVTEVTKRICHLPRILYHWRQAPTSSALHGNIKGNMDQLQAAAVQAHLLRTGRSDEPVARGGHRIRLRPRAIPTFAVVHETCTSDHAATALLQAVRDCTAEVLILIGPAAKQPDEVTLQTLAAASARSDVGIVAPVLLAREGTVAEAGRAIQGTMTVPLMRGFDPRFDGYHGSMSCTREVSVVSPDCIAVQCAKLADITDSSITWTGLLELLRQRGLWHRVCGGTTVALERSWRDTPELPPVPAGAVEVFYNRHFAPDRGDFTLNPDHPAPIPLWHLDTPINSKRNDGCVHWRGWCFWPGHPLRELSFDFTPDFSWPATLGLPRADVAASLEQPAAANVGFEIRLRLPPGAYHVIAHARTIDGLTHRLFETDVAVTRWAQWIRAWRGSGTDLLASQFPASPTQLPAPLAPAPAARAGRYRRGAQRFCIVTPSYQQATFLETCLRSVLDQAAPNLHCDYVVQDGGSTDGSVAIIERHAPQLLAWESGPDGGQAAAIARGFARMDGQPDDLMAWLNSDDFYLPGAFAEVAEYFAGHPEVDAVYSHRLLVDESDRVIGRWHLPPHDDPVLRLNDFVPQETLFWRRRIWDRVGGIDPSLQFAMDWDLLLRFQQAGARMVRLPRFLGGFRVHHSQKTSQAMATIGQAEIDWLRTRTHGRWISPEMLSADPHLTRYLRFSARLELLHHGAKAVGWPRSMPAN